MIRGLEKGRDICSARFNKFNLRRLLMRWKPFSVISSSFKFKKAVRTHFAAVILNIENLTKYGIKTVKKKKKTNTNKNSALKFSQNWKIMSEGSAKPILMVFFVASKILLFEIKKIYGKTDTQIFSVISNAKNRAEVAFAQKNILKRKCLEHE